MHALLTQHFSLVWIFPEEINQIDYKDLSTGEFEMEGNYYHNLLMIKECDMQAK